MEQHKPTSSQRKNALVTGIVLAAMALGVYLVMMLRVYTR